MSRYTDADALHDALNAKQKWVVRCGDRHNEGYTYDQVHFAIDDAPSIDIVRCKECKHSYEWDSGCGAELVCKARRCDPADWGSRVEFYVKADDFCSCGERK